MRRHVYFQHSTEIWSDHPELVAGVVAATGLTRRPGTADGVEAGRTAGDGSQIESAIETGTGSAIGSAIARFTAAAEARLETGPVAEQPEIRAWRRTFTRMGLKPTQYRCAAEALLRRFAREGSLPRIHPLIDLCNAASLAFAIPVGVFDVSRISGSLEVRPAEGSETYQTFSGEVEHPAAGEVIFADATGRAHARRWTNRQSGYSAVRESTDDILIVVEGLHGSAPVDVPKLTAALADELVALWAVRPTTAILTRDNPRFEFGR
ncbi:phenylalanine--tRNA ligase beta subunit-related protein [Micromonospora sp. WMMD1102]|uniref:B3/B4 domain-containing protein n=1 Tax=Micromonospora sp. WMMD1102 TaxID=3016105 RepID=UPI002415730E|nr:phenylalanine--tRNA ligase beta subunit-related protein [Micromonospora sp. WMMD1102]MDG4790640.1 phenylalanine--tRNA ligase beta subunit-related protein [Micromonospora sp. WMMD1102]